MARSAVSRNTSLVDELAFDAIASFLERTLGFENTFNYEVDHLMFHDTRVNGNLYNWTQAETQFMRDWLDDNGREDVQLIWNARNNSQANRQWAENPLVDHVLIEGNADHLLNNTNNRITFLNWFWDNPTTADKDAILMIPRSGNSSTQFQATRRAAIRIGEEIGYEEGMQTDRLVLFPVTYNDNYDYRPETTPDGASYTDSLTGLALSLIEQRDLFEGRTRLPTNADADSFAREVLEPDFGPLVAGWETWDEPAADTWVATRAIGVTAQAAGTPETGGSWFSFSNATVQNGASDDGRFGALGPDNANASVSDPNDAVTLSNGFDGSIEFTLTDTTGSARELTGFHFDLGAFRAGAATEWELEILAGGDLTAGTLSSGTATVNVGPIASDESVELTDLADSTLDPNGSVTFRLSFTGGTGEAGSPTNGHHLFLDNVGVTGRPVGGLQGDFNSDGVVDAADYTLWRDNQGAADESAIDFNGDGGGIGPSDLDLWRANYGQSASSSAAEPPVATPEPGALLLAAYGVVLALAPGARAPLEQTMAAR